MSDNTKRITLGRFYKHIDNGGPMISVEQSTDGDTNDDGSDLVYHHIKLIAAYHGNPSVECELNLGTASSEDFRDIGLMFLDVASKLKNKQQKELCHVQDYVV